MKYADRAREIIDIEIKGLELASRNLGKEFGRVVDLILQAVGNGKKIIVTGVGKNLPIGQKMASTLSSTGSPAVFMHATDAMHGDLGILSDGDVLIALSYSGESEELINLLPVIKRKEVKIVAMTGSRDNTLANHADEVLLVTVEREACPFNLAPTASTTATLAVGDALAMVLLEARGFKREDYAKLHPAGAIGRTLLLHVRDIMRTADRIARCKPGDSVNDGIMAMTEARSGAIVVVDNDDKVLGIFTDGDLRRHITGTDNLRDKKMKDVMSPRPITVVQDHLAVDVLAMFEKHNVDDLVVVDQDARLVGVVDIQDLPKLKII